MTYPLCEPTIEEIMSDAAVVALMKADRVDPVQFESRLRKVGKRAGGYLAPPELCATGVLHRRAPAECRC